MTQMHEKRKFTVTFGCGKKVLMKKAGSCESKFNKIPADIYACSTPQNIGLTLLTLFAAGSIHIRARQKPWRRPLPSCS